MVEGGFGVGGGDDSGGSGGLKEIKKVTEGEGFTLLVVKILVKMGCDGINDGGNDESSG